MYKISDIVSPEIRMFGPKQPVTVISLGGSVIDFLRTSRTFRESA